MRPRIAFVASTEMTVKGFLVDHLKGLSEKYELALVLPTDDPGFLQKLGLPGKTFPVAIKRKISLLDDLNALISLIWLFRREKFDAVHSVTPKAGLLAMLAAKMTGVPCRTHWFTGQVWATKTGFARFVLKSIDRLTHAASSFSLVDSPSQRDFLIENNVLGAQKSAVLADGSICGVNAARFRPDPAARAEIRSRYGFEDDDVVFLFLGRLTRDKGVLDLARAFREVAEQRSNVRLLLVGPDEEDMRGRMEDLLGPALKLSRFEPYTSTPERYMAACEVFCLPSYREGFGSVVIEAAAVGVPALASRIYGVTDAIEDNVGGLLHVAGDVDDVRRKLDLLAGDRELRARLAASARERAVTKFSSQRVVQALIDYYVERLPPTEDVRGAAGVPEV
jgi:glycosyltransferase involved in cell wall biosynthesis